ncbi:hypothetical protein E4A49_06815 [Micrococcus lylae]|uniref:Uncharacterized protein n=1 Tax=Micrococcus lylae TaxID=1273 RepID=A0ABY2K166_9MICC|nr:hypothetical protein E4A49_06815 [Micrococcus lylae]
MPRGRRRRRRSAWPRRRRSTAWTRRRTGWPPSRRPWPPRPTPPCSRSPRLWLPPRPTPPPTPICAGAPSSRTTSSGTWTTTPVPAKAEPLRAR